MNKILLIIFFLLTLFIGAEKRPNILFIAVDDMKPLLRLFPQILIDLPSKARLSPKATVSGRCVVDPEPV